MGGAVFLAVTACRICGSNALEGVLDLGMQALTGRFPRAGEADPPTAPLELVRCTCCGLVQLRHSTTVDELFTDGYGYRSGLNDTMRRHLAGVVEDMLRHRAVRADEVVLDIGCNDGTLLKCYPEAVTCVGIDPLADKFAQHYPDRFRCAAAFFNADTFRRLSDRRASAITSIAMFYDLEDPGQFVRDIAACLDDDGIWVLEQSYLPSMLELNSYDTVCHEHLEYYALAQIELMAGRAGLRVFDVSLNASNGGSFRVFVCHHGAAYGETAAVAAMREREKLLGLSTSVPFDAFRARCEALRSQLHQFVVDNVGQGKTFYLYGASTKGNTILQYCGIDAALVKGAAERNPEKYGSRTPGTNIPIVSEEEARAAKPDYFLVLPWHFRAEFEKREAAFRAGGGKLVFPLPTLSVV